VNESDKGWQSLLPDGLERWLKGKKDDNQAAGPGTELAAVRRCPGARRIVPGSFPALPAARRRVVAGSRREVPRVRGRVRRRVHARHQPVL